ncbi:MAG TPA: DUF1559 domain-containing protein [Gemmatales bacterium]|nr:DUF1559 domain-containing protein [Gemmatales bacterium]HMP61427.1 DUF1559 domain-containing protein [Gemmatales bacterium]
MRRNGVTLVETLVVLGAIGMLLALALPAIQQVRGVADRLACQSNMRQIVVAMHHYHNDHQVLPRRWFGFDAPEARLSWMAHLLPYIEQNSLYQMAKEDFRSYPGTGQIGLHRALSTVVKLYACPADARLRAAHSDPYGQLGAFATYMGMIMAQNPNTGRLHATAMGVNLAEIVDGTSNTVVIGERPPPNSFVAGWWYVDYLCSPSHRGPSALLWPGFLTPAVGCWPDCRRTRLFGPGRLDNPCDRFHFWSLHSGGSNFAFVDGSVRFLSYRIGEDTLAALFAINDGAPLTLPDD